MTIENAQRITIIDMGRRINTAKVKDILKQELDATQYRDAYHLPVDEGECWLFNYGVLVAWGLGDTSCKQLCASLNSVVEEPISYHPIEQYEWHVEDREGVLIHHDCLSLPDNNPLTKLALSHAFAQSAKLIFFEDKAQQVIDQNAYISRELAQTGKVPLSRHELAKLRGVLFETTTDISLHYGLLDVPEFFWDYPELEETYLKLAKYLDLQPRIDILTKKLETIHALLDMLTTDQNSKHSAFLEWIIIILIAVDIVIYFV